MEIKETKHGYVKSVLLDKGFAFIRTTDKDETDYFVRLENVLGGKLKKYQEVDFVPQKTERGLVALGVIITKDVPEIEEKPVELIELEKGYVKFYNEEKGLGFITSCKDNVTDFFAYHVNLHDDGTNKPKVLKKGQVVEFIPIDTEKGPLALDIVVIKDVQPYKN